MFSFVRLLVAISIPTLFFGQTQIVLQQSKYSAPGSGAVSRSGQAKLAEAVSVKDYGAVGNGATDDLPAINQAFAAVAGSGQRLLFPAGTYMVSGTVVIPNKAQIFGVGRGDAGYVNTVIKALPSFPAGGTVVQMGPAPGPNFGVQIQNLSIDGSGVAGVCLSNINSEELSYGKDLLLTGCGSIGLSISTGGSQNSGPFENLEIYPGGGPNDNVNSMCIQVTGSIAFRGISGVTCNGNGYTARPAIAMALDGDGHYSNIHIEHFTTGILLGNANNSADGITVENAEFGPDVATGLQINLATGINNQNLAIFGIKCIGCTNLLNDQELGITNNDNSIGWYMIGNGAGWGKPMLSGNYGVGSQVYGPFHAYGTGSVGAGNTNQEGTFTLWDASPTGVTRGIEFEGAAQGGTNLFEWRNNNDQTMTLVGSDGHISAPEINAQNGAAAMTSTGSALANNAPLIWSSTTSWNGTPDTGLARSSAGVVQVTNGSTGSGSLASQSLQLGGTATQPACSASVRGTFWFTQSPAGSADHLQVCAKSAANTYSWITVF